MRASLLPGDATASLRAAFAAWARRRQGPDADSVRLTRRRIYILPTRYGAVFACLLFAMLLGSMNYGASLGFALTFLLTGLGLVALHQCRNNLLGLEVGSAGARPVCAGDDAQLHMRLSSTDAAPRYELELTAGGRSSGPADLAPFGSVVLAVAMPTRRRGWLELPRITVTTRHPASLCRAWSYVHPRARCLVYPRPSPAGALPPPVSPELGAHSAARPGETDFAGLRNAVRGDPPRRLAWKAYARTGKLLFKQFADGEIDRALFDFDAPALRHLEPEQRLSALTRWCIDAAAEQRPFGLRLPEQTIQPGSGDRHLHRCLEALALCPAGEGPAP